MRVVPEVLGQPEHDVVTLFPLDHLGESSAADGDLNDLFHVGDVDAVAGTGPAIDLDFQVGLTDDVKDPDVDDTGNAAENIDHPLAGLFERGEVVADELDGVCSLDA